MAGTEREFYRVTGDTGRAPLGDHLMHGYAERQDFLDAVRRLVSLWKGRVGERVGERHGFLLLRFHDTPGGVPDEEWLPPYLLDRAEMPAYLAEGDGRSDEERELDSAFGFD